MKITKISEIIDITDFKIPYSKQQDYTKKILDEYGENGVIAYKITEKSCFILLKGRRKFFLLKLSPDLKRYKRMTFKNISNDLQVKGLVITNNTEYQLFIKTEVINRLK